MFNISLKNTENAMKLYKIIQLSFMAQNTNMIHMDTFYQ